jgi:putative membrane protein
MEKSDTRRRGAIFLAPAAVILLLASGLAQARTPDSTETDRTFVKKAIQGDLAEIEIGKLAQQKGASEKVKQFGQRLEADHTANLEKAKPLAGSLGSAPPTAPNANQKAAYDKLSSLSGREFDRTFAKKMLKDHKKDIKEFQRESRRSGPAADFAKRTLPTLEEHLKLAKSLSGSRT